MHHPHTWWSTHNNPCKHQKSIAIQLPTKITGTIDPQQTWGAGFLLLAAAWACALDSPTSAVGGLHICRIAHGPSSQCDLHSFGHGFRHDHGLLHPCRDEPYRASRVCRHRYLVCASCRRHHVCSVFFRHDLHHILFLFLSFQAVLSDLSFLTVHDVRFFHHAPSLNHGFSSSHYVHGLPSHCAQNG